MNNLGPLGSPVAYPLDAGKAQTAKMTFQTVTIDVEMLANRLQNINTQLHRLAYLVGVPPTPSPINEARAREVSPPVPEVLLHRLNDAQRICQNLVGLIENQCGAIEGQLIG